MNKTILLFVVMVIFQSLIGEGYAQSCLPAAPVTTTFVTTRLQEGSRVTDIIHEVVVMRTERGQIVHKINVESIRILNGSASLIDETSTTALFDALSYSTIQQGAKMGYPACPVSCTAPAQVRVETPGCVRRSGSGLATTFSACTTQECSWRNYLICCPNEAGVPEISPFDKSPRMQCGEPTCENSCQ